MCDHPVYQPQPCPPRLPATTLPMYSLPWLLISAPPTCLDECFFFNYLVVGLPYSSIFWEFWLVLFLVFKLLVVLLLDVQESKEYLLCLHVGLKSIKVNFLFIFLLILSGVFFFLILVWQLLLYFLFFFHTIHQ